MRRVRKRVRKKKRSYFRLDAFARGMIWALYSLAGWQRKDIQKNVEKSDGAQPSLKAVDDTLAKKRKCPEWRGDDEEKSGRPEMLTKTQKLELKRLVFREHGKQVVTVRFCKKHLPFLRGVSKTTVGKALHDVALKWLTRRMKTKVPGESKEARIKHCKWLLKQERRYLNKFAYTDGTTFYLARGPQEHDQKKHAALGKYVWRMANGKDGLFDENVGPSLYAKSQGKAVKIWGLFANGKLHYWVLPVDKTKKKYKTTNMNTTRYRKLIESHFAEWRRDCFGNNARVPLVQDHEGCLWEDGNLRALSTAGLDVLNHPKHSPDLNAIENMWLRVRQRLQATEPVEHEDRPAFLARLRRTVDWLNDNCHADLLTLCTNQKKRARDVLDLSGAKCSF